MPASILLMYLIAFGAAMALSRNRNLGPLRKGAANAALLIAAYALLVDGDYLSMAATLVVIWLVIWRYGGIGLAMVATSANLALAISLSWLAVPILR